MPTDEKTSTVKASCQAKNWSALMGIDCFSTENVQPIKVVSKDYIGTGSGHINACRSCRAYFTDHFA